MSELRRQEPGSESLEDVLANILPDKSDVIAAISAARLDEAKINLDDSPLNRWVRVLREARKSANKLEELIVYARDRYPDQAGRLDRAKRGGFLRPIELETRSARPVDLLETERIDIEKSRRLISSRLGSGDIALQQDACERLAELAEESFPSCYPDSVVLLSRINRLNDEIRTRQSSESSWKPELDSIVASAVKLVQGMEIAKASARVLSKSAIDLETAREIRQEDASRFSDAWESSNQAESDPTAIEDTERILLEWLVRFTGRA